jgi:O-antigen/teichoic acid export membrane protein
VRQSLRAMGLQGFALVIGFFSGAALARGLGVDGRGDYQIVALVYGLSAPLLNMGFPSYLTGRRAGEALPWRSISAALLISWAAGAVATSAVPLSSGELVLVAALLAGPLVSPYTEMILYREGRGSIVQALRVLDVGSSGIAIIMLGLLGHLTLLTATLSLFGTTVILRVGIILYRLARVGREQWAVPCALPDWKLALARLWSWDVMVALSTFADVLIAARLLTRTELGVYAIAVAVGRLSGAAFSASSPLVVAAAGRGEPMRDIVMRLTRLPLLASLAALCIFALFGSEMVHFVYGAPFTPAVGAATWLIAATCVTGIVAHMEAAALGALDRMNSAVPRVAAASLLVVLSVVIDLFYGLTPTTLACGVMVAALMSAGMTFRQVRRRVSSR